MNRLNAPPAPALFYRVFVKGHLDNHWTEWFDGIVLAHQDDGTTMITAKIPDQAALYGLLGKLRDGGVTLLAIDRGTAGHHT